ncbi:hypothetical protein UFOVP75_140 [uncultured Caudovirales phage]|uniref:Uncharacterized protein n=1 Tax=uncultured Caudovirales phage TaxID=2100421 RepID=A0A6J5L160_9CAUD|nr:hypothetical protein UFOVP75_140 [uncultured Caudovirales phage]
MGVPFLDTWVPNGNFPIVNNQDVLGGFHLITWTHGSGPTDSRNAARLGTPTGVRVAQMPIRVLDATTGLVDEFVWDGGGDTDANFVPYIPANSIGQSFYGLISGGALTVSGATATVAAIRLVDGDGLVFATQGDTVPFTTVSSGGTTVVFYNSALKRLEEQLLASNTLTRSDVPLKVLVRSGSNVITKVVDCTPHAVLHWDTTVATVGDGTVPAHFNSLKAALVWRNVLRNSATSPVAGIPNRFSIAASQIPAIRTVTGTCDVSGSSVTGHSSKFISEFRAGDLFSTDGTTFAVVQSVSSNVALLLATSLSTVTGQPVIRGEATGPNSSMIDLTQEEFVNLSGLSNVEFCGINQLAASPIVLQSGFSSIAVNSDPFFTFGSPTPVSWDYNSIQLKYSGTLNQSDNGRCLVKNAGPGNWNQVGFDSGQKWSTCFLWDTAVNLGTNPDANNFMKLEDCNFIENGASVAGASMFRSTASLSGILIARNCKCAGTGSSPATSVFDWGSTTSSVDARWEGGRIDNVRTAIFNHDTHLSGIGYAGSPKQLIDTQIGANTVSGQLAVVSPAESATSARAHVRGLQTFAAFFYRGAELVVDAKTRANVVTNLSSGGSYYAVDFTSAGGPESTSTDGAPLIIIRNRPSEVTSLTNLLIALGTLSFPSTGNVAVVNTLGATYLKAKSDALALGSGCSQIVNGGEFDWDGSIARIKRGTFIFSSGKTVVKTSDTTLTPPVNGGGQMLTPFNTVTGAVYVYLGATGALFASLNPPNAAGNDSTSSSPVPADTCYVGSFLATSGFAGNSRSWTPSGTMRRTSTHGSLFGTNAPISGSLFGNQLSFFTTGSTNGLKLTSGTGVLRNEFPTARSLHWDLGVFFAPVSGTVNAAVMVVKAITPTGSLVGIGLEPIVAPIGPVANWLSTNSSGVVGGSGAIAPQSINRSITTENFLEPTGNVPLLNFSFLTSSAVSSTGTWGVQPVSTFGGYTEDVNQPTPWV